MAYESLPQTYRALVLTDRQKPMTIETRPLPQSNAGSAVVRVLAIQVVSYAGDVFTGARPYPFPTPLVPGGPCVARVASVGADATVLKPGQLVYVHLMLTARDDTDERSLFGLMSMDELPSGNLMKSTWRDATLAEYARVPMENCIPLDENRLLGSPKDGGLGYNIEDLAYLQLPLVAYGGLSEVELKPGQTIAIAPATGGFGGAAVQVALAMGAGRVIAMGRNDEALKRLQKLDSQRVKTMKITGNFDQELEALQALGPIDAFLELSPPQAAENLSYLRAGIASLRRRGRAGLMGGMFGDVSIPFQAVMSKSLQLRGKWMYEREEIKEYMQIVHSGQFKLGQEGGVEIMGKFSLARYQEAFDLASQNAQPGQMTVIVP